MPSRTLRQTVLASARQIVVKLGTQLLTRDDGQLDAPFLKQIADQIARLRRDRVKVTIVSSGAIGAGWADLGLNKRPKDVAELQAVAAVGQRCLMTHMHNAFILHQIPVGQLLLTRSDFDDRVRFLNIRNCITQLHQLGCVPVINENDTVAVDELRFGDNDMLAALMCNAIPADALILLTVVDGLLDENNHKIDLVRHPDEYCVSAKQKTPLGTGGIRSKLEAANLVTEAGELAVIANGREPDVLLRLFSLNEQIGTVFAPAPRKLDSRKRWIGLTKRPSGTLIIDDGAVGALRQRGKSLLASGITALSGQFERGDVLLVQDQAGCDVARGLTNYGADELRLVMGKRSIQFEKILGRAAYAEVIHRDNLVLVRQ